MPATLEPLVGLHACQPKGRSAFEREQVARVAHELRDDLLGFRRGRRRSGSGRWAWTGRDHGLFDRTWQQTCHGQDARMAGWPLGFLAEQVAYLLAYGVAQLSLEGRIGRGERLGQIAQIVGLTELMATVGQRPWRQPAPSPFACR